MNTTEITTQQINQLRRLKAACENAKTFTQSGERQDRLDAYMDKLIAAGINADAILAVIN